MTEKQNFFNEILDSCCSIIDIDIRDVMSELRNREYVNARSVSVCIMKDLFPKMTTILLGAYIRRNHATIIYYLKRHDALMFSDYDYREMYNNVYPLFKDKKSSVNLTPYESLLNKYCSLSKKYKEIDTEYSELLDKYKSIEQITNY